MMSSDKGLLWSSQSNSLANDCSFVREEMNVIGMAQNTTSKKMKRNPSVKRMYLYLGYILHRHVQPHCVGEWYTVMVKFRLPVCLPTGWRSQMTLILFLHFIPKGRNSATAPRCLQLSTLSTCQVTRWPGVFEGFSVTWMDTALFQDRKTIQK